MQDWYQVLTIAGTTIAAVWAMSRENKAERAEFKSEIKEIIVEMQKEQKSFHGRMCAIEERYYQMMQRYWESRK